jgi:hypothetical protein
VRISLTRSRLKEMEMLSLVGKRGRRRKERRGAEGRRLIEGAGLMKRWTSIISLERRKVLEVGGKVMRWIAGVQSPDGTKMAATPQSPVITQPPRGRITLVMPLDIMLVRDTVGMYAGSACKA